MTYAEVIDYITLRAKSHKKIKSVVVADYEDINDKSREDIAYPCFWVETPKVRINGTSDSFTDEFTLTFVVLASGDPKDREKSKYNMEQTYRIAKSFLTRLIMDIDGSIANFTIANRQLEPIASIHNDTDQGWRCTVEVEVAGEGCYDASEWDETMEPMEAITFTFNRVSGAYSITSINNTLQGAWVIDWKASVEDEDMEVIDPNDLSEFGNRLNLLVVVTATLGAKKRQWSAYLNADGQIQSVPYIYSEYR